MFMYQHCVSAVFLKRISSHSFQTWKLYSNLIRNSIKNWKLSSVRGLRHNSLVTSLSGWYCFLNINKNVKLLISNNSYYLCIFMAYVIDTKAPFLKMYDAYASNYSSALELYASLLEQPKFAKVLEECRRKTGGDLETFLITPIQRVPLHSHNYISLIFDSSLFFMSDWLLNWFLDSAIWTPSSRSVETHSWKPSWFVSNFSSNKESLVQLTPQFTSFIPCRLSKFGRGGPKNQRCCWSHKHKCEECAKLKKSCRYWNGCKDFSSVFLFLIWYIWFCHFLSCIFFSRL